MLSPYDWEQCKVVYCWERQSSAASCPLHSCIRVTLGLEHFLAKRQRALTAWARHIASGISFPDPDLTCTSLFCLWVCVLWHLDNPIAVSVPGGEVRGSFSCSIRGGVQTIFLCQRLGKPCWPWGMTLNCWSWSCSVSSLHEESGVLFSTYVRRVFLCYPDTCTPCRIDTLELLLLGNRCHLFDICSLLSCYTSYLNTYSVKWDKRKKQKAYRLEQKKRNFPSSQTTWFSTQKLKKKNLKEKSSQNL